jgi:hypothetical protein
VLFIMNDCDVGNDKLVVLTMWLHVCVCFAVSDRDNDVICIYACYYSLSIYIFQDSSLTSCAGV